MLDSLLPFARAASLALALTLAGCGGGDDASTPAPASPASAAAEGFQAPAVRFEDATAALGVDVRHRPDIAGTYSMPAIMSGGAAVFDVEGDGDLDLYIVQPAGLPNVLLRQEDGRFTPVESGAGDRGDGMGVAVGDADNDGDLDLFVSNVGPDALLRNDGDGTFTDVTRQAGVASDGWSSSATFFDYDLDGLLDLFVVRYVAYDPDRVCASQSGRRDFCGPAQFQGVSDRLYRNLGGLHFEETSREAGIETLADRGLGVVAADFDGDGLLDLYVANDTDPNHLWINGGDGRFVEDGVLLGVAFNRFGVGEAGMGVAAGDVDLDGDPDLFVSHLIEETNTLYENRGAVGFEDVTSLAGLGVGSVGYTGFGTALADLDNDSALDLVVANGAVKQRPSALVADPGVGWAKHEYVEPNQLYWNTGAGTFVEGAGGAFSEALEVSRGLLAADLDGDLDLDLVLTQIDGPVQVFRNAGGSGGAVAVWVRERGRVAFGAQVEARLGDRRLKALVQPLAGYLTSGVVPAHFGLGGASAVDAFEVTWPDGSVESFPGSPAGTVVSLERGQGGAS